MCNKKKTIGILTFYDGINYGAFFQCYALYNVINNMGFNVKIISFKSITHFINEYKHFLINYKPSVLIKNIMKIYKFRRAQKKMKRTPFVFNSMNLKEIFDIIIVGSDMVWDFKSSFTGFSSTYFGFNLNTKKLISYAASFGEVSLNDNVPEIVVEGLKKFDNISVRDVNSQVIIKKMLDLDVRTAIDPVFLYDFSDDIIKCKFYNFILIYAFSISKVLQSQIKDFAAKKNLKIISIGYNSFWADKHLIAVSPFEWLGYLKNASYVITTTFHGTLFSIKFNKKFCLLINNKAVENKIVDLLIDLNIEKQIYKKSSLIEDILSYNIDYEVVNSKLLTMINNSNKYLRNSII